MPFLCHDGMMMVVVMVMVEARWGGLLGIPGTVADVHVLCSPSCHSCCMELSL